MNKLIINQTHQHLASKKILKDQDLSIPGVSDYCITLRTGWIKVDATNALFTGQLICSWEELQKLEEAFRKDQDDKLAGPERGSNSRRARKN